MLTTLSYHILFCLSIKKRVKSEDFDMNCVLTFQDEYITMVLKNKMEGDFL